jgi:hypothetical protein
MQLEEIKAIVAEARQHINSYNELARKLADVGVTIEIDINYYSHGKVSMNLPSCYLTNSNNT